MNLCSALDKPFGGFRGSEALLILLILGGAGVQNLVLYAYIILERSLSTADIYLNMFQNKSANHSPLGF